MWMFQIARVLASHHGGPGNNFFPMFVGHFCPPGSGYGYGSRDPFESGSRSNPDPDPIRIRTRIQSGYGSGSTTLLTRFVLGHDCKLKKTSPTAYCDCWEKCKCRALVAGHQGARFELLSRIIAETGGDMTLCENDRIEKTIHSKKAKMPTKISKTTLVYMHVLKSKALWVIKVF
jgi:hypothetical protein